MKNTIDYYWLNRHIIEMPKKIARPDRALYANLLIAEINDYDCANLSNQYLWHIDTPKGTATWNAVKAVIPPKNRYLFITYTNSLKGNRLIRMTQNVWAFPNMSVAEEYLPEMIADVLQVSHSHLLYIELDNQLNLQKQLLDYYYFDDYKDLLNRGGHYQLLTTQAKAIDLTEPLTTEQFKQLYNYQKRLFTHQAQIIQSGLNKATRIENKSLIKQRKKLLQILN